MKVLAGTTLLLIGSNVFHIRFRWDFAWAFLCLLGAVFFAFRGGIDAP